MRAFLETRVFREIGSLTPHASRTSTRTLLYSGTISRARILPIHDGPRLRLYIVGVRLDP